MNLLTNQDHLEERHNEGENRESDCPPLGPRLILFLSLSFGGLVVSLRGWLNLDDDRRLFRAASIGGGLLLSSCGSVLWLATLGCWW